MRKSILAITITGFVVSLLTLFLVSWVSIKSIDALRAAGKDQLDWAMLTKELGDITPALLLTENGRRNYVPLRNPRALTVFKQGIESIHKEMDEIVALARSYPDFLGRIVDLQQSVDEAVLTLQDSIAAFEEDGDMRLQDGYMAKGMSVVERIRSSIEALTNEIHKESEQREAIVDQRTNAAKRFIFLMVFIAVAGGCIAVYIIARDLAIKARLQKKQEELIEQLSQALGEVKTLSGLLPICACCKKIRNDSGYWTQIEVYVTDHSEAHFSHGLCEECAATLYPDLYVPKEIRDQSKNGGLVTEAPPSSSRFPGSVE